jgi:hypothetical protein
LPKPPGFARGFHLYRLGNAGTAIGIVVGALQGVTRALGQPTAAETFALFFERAAPAGFLERREALAGISVYPNKAPSLATGMDKGHKILLDALGFDP